MTIIFNVPAVVAASVCSFVSPMTALTRPSLQIVACRAVRRLTNFGITGGLEV
jgi:hypothetical protein